jgi:hypothetical protein
MAKTKKIKKTVSPKRDRVARMFKYIIAGMTNEAALAKILKEEPKASTNLASMQWTRSQLRQKSDYAKKFNPKGIKVLTNRELKLKASKPARNTAKAKAA